MHFAVVDRDRKSVAAVLMLLHDEAEAIAIDLREHEVRADAVGVDRALLSSLEDWTVSGQQHESDRTTQHVPKPRLVGTRSL